MKLGYMMLLVAVGAMLVVAPSAMAADKGGGKGHDKGLFGKVTANDGKIATIELMAKKDAPPAEKKTVTTDADTKFVKGEKGAETPAAVGDATVDAHVMVTLDGEKVAKVVIMPAGGHKGGHGAPPAAPPQ
jgi:hypothetical protein